MNVRFTGSTSRIDISGNTWYHHSRTLGSCFSNCIHGRVGRSLVGSFLHPSFNTCGRVPVKLTVTRAHQISVHPLSPSSRFLTPFSIYPFFTFSLLSSPPPLSLSLFHLSSSPHPPATPRAHCLGAAMQCRPCHPAVGTNPRLQSDVSTAVQVSEGLSE